MLAELSPTEAYLEGRLLGLSELIDILRDSLESGGEPASSAVIKSIVLHISNEMDSIIVEMKKLHGEEHPVLKQAERKTVVIEKEARKIEPATTPPAQATAALKKNVEAADDLMKSLMELREKGGSE